MALRTPMRPSATPMLRWKLLRPAVHRPFSSCKALWHSSSANDSPLVETSVVGSFLFRLDADGKPRVALFRRSGQVKTYKYARTSSPFSSLLLFSRRQ
jgi:hypothetical protein